MKKYLATLEFSNGGQQTFTFDHPPFLGTVVKAPGTDRYGEVLSVSAPLVEEPLMDAADRKMENS